MTAQQVEVEGFDWIIEGALCRERRVDVALRKGRFAAIEPAGTLAQAPAKTRWAGQNYLLRPPFYNTHTHQAMTLLRGIDDDCALMDWLTRCIWPREARHTHETVYAGARLAILEGIRSGCVAFNDMYFHQMATLRAVQEMGVRARLGVVVQDQVSTHFENEALLAARETLPPTINLAMAPHALYTTTPEQLRQAAAEARRLNLPLHLHAAESRTECAIARERFGAASPVAYLDQCGVLQPGTILAHGCHLSAQDREVLAARGCILATCPNSNAKLASGSFHWAEAARAGIPITVGTDGAASNNALSMIAEAKAAALTAKLTAEDPAALPFAELDRAVTEVAASALGFPEAGRIAPGCEADFILVDLRAPAFAAGGEADANFIYAADSAAVDTVVCRGRVLMRHRVVEDEAEILAEAGQAARALR